MESLFSPVPPQQRSTTPPMPSTTDFAVIEAQKENIKPAASGRSASTLFTLLDKDGEGSKAVQEGHERFKRDIEEAERRDKDGEDMQDGVLDVLDVHSRYILFNIQHHPTSDHKLLPLLERTAIRFVDDVRYQQDVRYLKIWVQYARLVERREEIWAFLEARSIGTNHAQFYEEWASAMEGLSRKKKADEIYKIGIARRAAPLERLKTRHQAFLDRALAVGGQIPDDEPSSSSSRANRAALGQVATGPSGLSGAAQLAPSMRSSVKGNGARLEVFADGENPVERAESGEWADFGTRDGRRKENTVEATPWKGETLTQSAAKHRVTPRTPKVEVFKDLTCSDGNSALRPADGLFGRSKQPSSEAELIKSNPLRLFSAAPTSSVPSLPPPPVVRKAPRPVASVTPFVMSTWECPDGPETRDSKGKVKERRMFDHNQVYKSGKEWSFEEVRARQRGLLTKETREIKSWELSWHAPGSSTPKKELPRTKPPSPTVNTKLAAQEIAAMFDQTIHGGKIRDSESESSDESDEEEAAPINVAPTPLPASRPMTMPTPSHSMVPPTPTPAPAAASTGRLNIFADENAPPPSAAKPARLNIFTETPARTPLTARTPTAAPPSSSSRPNPFGVFSDENDAPAQTPSIRRPMSNVFATPALKSKAPARRILGSAIPEESEDEREVDEDQLLQQVIQDEHVNMTDDEGEEIAPRRRRFNIHEMTPITERTCEFTTHTQFTTTSLSSSVNQLAQSGRRASVKPEPVEQENGSGSAPISGMEQLSIVDEGEEDRSGPLRESSPSLALKLGELGDVGSDDAFSDTASPFRMPDGYTIQGATRGFDASLPVIDRTATQHFLRETSAEPEEETGQFVTASGGDLAGVNLPNPCNPSDEQVISALLSRVQPPLSSLPGFQDFRSNSIGKLDAIQKHFKARQRKSQNGRQSLAPSDYFILDLAGKKYELAEKIGEGGFGAVFLAVDMAKRDEADARSDNSDEDDEEDFFVAIKVEKPASVWEAIIVDRIRRGIDASLLSSIIQTKDLFAFQDESYLLLEYSSQGTLLDLVNKATTLSIAPATSGAPPAVDELLAVFFTIELLRFIEGLHSAGFIHGDLKIDNCLVRLEALTAAEGGASGWSAQYTRNGSNGWAKKGVRIIDFGRAIDTSLFPAGTAQEFVADWPIDERDCLELKEGRSWSWQTDYAGLASVAYCLLFGKYIQTEVVEQDGRRRVKISTPLKRYWQTEIWVTLFDTLLNPKMVRADGSLPITSELADIRGKFEQWLEENCQRNGKNLRQMLKKVETAAVLCRRI